MRQYVNPAQPEVSETSMPFITERDQDALFAIRMELEQARAEHPAFRHLGLAIAEVQNRAAQVDAALSASRGTMDAEVRRKLLQTAAMCVRAFAEFAA